MRRATLFALGSTPFARWAAAGEGGGGPAAVAPPPATDAQTRAIVAATTAFLRALGDAQRAAVRFPFAPQGTATAARYAARYRGGPNGGLLFVGERYGQAVWSNFPVSDVPRPGLKLGGLDAAQRGAAMDVLKALLSPGGYRKVVDIMDSDQLLAESGTPYATGTDHYTLGVFGAPSDTAPWMLQFGGHHLGLNAVVVGPHVALAPALTGTQPASYVRDGRVVRPLGAENDRAFALMNSFGVEQRRRATLEAAVRDLVLGPGQDGRTLPPEGLPGSEMTEAQRAALLGLIGEWVGMLNAGDAAPKMARARADLGRTRFAWYGDTVNPSPVYYRVAGPTVHIEFAHQQWDRPGSGAQANGVNHIHTVYPRAGWPYRAASARRGRARVAARRRSVLIRSPGRRRIGPNAAIPRSTPRLRKRRYAPYPQGPASQASAAPDRYDRAGPGDLPVELPTRSGFALDPRAARATGSKRR